mgnify:FL=1
MTTLAIINDETGKVVGHISPLKIDAIDEEFAFVVEEEVENDDGTITRISPGSGPEVTDSVLRLGPSDVGYARTAINALPYPYVPADPSKKLDLPPPE